MDPVVLDNIPFRIDIPDLLTRLRVDPASHDADEVRSLAAQAESAGRPKALYGVSYIESRSDASVVIDGVAFESRVLRVNTDPVHRVFPHVATCGRELDRWAESFTDPLAAYWADTIKRVALSHAAQALQADLDRRFEPGPVSKMSPGSLTDWPIQQQRPLFQLLRDPEARIGVHLSDSFLMVPTKSISGIYFPTQVRFESCQLCPRESCPGRRAPYDPHLWETRYGKSKPQP